MGRSPAYSADALLNAAAELFSGGGVQAVTMTAVATAVGAPSGSVYHRFPDRPSLLATLWLRTATTFERGYFDALGEQPTTESAIEAAVWTVEWCRANPAGAAVLQAGHRMLKSHTWSAAEREQLLLAGIAREKQIRAAVRAVASRTGRPRDEVAFAMFDLPLAVVRPHLLAREPIPATAAGRVRRLATRLLLD